MLLSFAIASGCGCTCRRACAVVDDDGSVVVATRKRSNLLPTMRTNDAVGIDDLAAVLAVHFVGV